MREAVAVLLIEGPRILGFRHHERIGLSVPCGKREEGETLEECGIRECLEETGLTVRICSDKPFVGFDVAGNTLVTTYKVEYVSGTLTKSGEGIPQWSSIAEVAYGYFWHYNQRMLRHFGVKIPLIGKFHSHLTISAKSDDEAKRAAALVKGKITVIDLSRGDKIQTDYMITHHYVTGFHGLEDSFDIISLLKSMARQINDSGISVTRVKLEHELLDARSDRRDIPSSLDSIYTEVHVKCVLAESDRGKLITVASNAGWHPSRNPFSKSDDGKITQFVNRRFYGKSNLVDIDLIVDSIVKEISCIAEIKEIKYESAIFDSNEALDAWWMK